MWDPTPSAPILVSSSFRPLALYPRGGPRGATPLFRATASLMRMRALCLWRACDSRVRMPWRIRAALGPSGWAAAASTIMLRKSVTPSPLDPCARSLRLGREAPDSPLLWLWTRGLGSHRALLGFALLQESCFGWPTER